LKLDGRRCSIFAALASCLFSAPGNASTVLFNDLGTGASVYNDDEGWAVQGSGAPEGAITIADEFKTEETGGFSLSEIDLAMGNITSPNTFYVSIWTDVRHHPGTKISGAYWTTSTPYMAFTCCGVVSIDNITGVTLTGGQSYYLVLGPLNPSGDSSNEFALNNQNVDGNVENSVNGGVSWYDIGNGTLGAFDVLGNPVVTPEPALMPVLVLGLGLIGFRFALAKQPCAKLPPPRIPVCSSRSNKYTPNSYLSHSSFVGISMSVCSGPPRAAGRFLIGRLKGVIGTVSN
jgi:hypothetical protein